MALHDLLAARGGRILVIQSQLDAYSWHLSARVRRLRPDLELLLLERTVPRELTLVVNNHPNATTLRWRAIATAQRLLARGFLDVGDNLPLPELPWPFRTLLRPPALLDELEALSERARVEASASLRALIDLRTGEGIRQLFGGLNLDGSVRLHLLALLASIADRAVHFMTR